jgi:hypothetical protein
MATFIIATIVFCSFLGVLIHLIRLKIKTGRFKNCSSCKSCANYDSCHK